MFPGRKDVYDKPVYSLQVDHSGQRVIVISRCLYNNEPNYVYRYITIPFDSQIWTNALDSSTVRKEWLRTYFPSKRPNVVSYDMTGYDEITGSIETTKYSEPVSDTYDRTILFYQKRRNSVDEIRTTSNGFYYDGYATVPYHIGLNWRLNTTMHTTNDIIAKESPKFGIRMIKIENDQTGATTVLKATEDNLIYVDFSPIAKGGEWSDLVKSCDVEFTKAPLVGSNGFLHYCSQCLYTESHNLQSYISYSFSMTAPTSVEERTAKGGYPIEALSEYNNAKRDHVLQFTSDYDVNWDTGETFVYPDKIRNSYKGMFLVDDRLMILSRAIRETDTFKNFNLAMLWVQQKEESTQPVTANTRINILASSTDIDLSLRDYDYSHVNWHFVGGNSPSAMAGLIVSAPGEETMSVFQNTAIFQNIKYRFSSSDNYDSTVYGAKFDRVKFINATCNSLITNEIQGNQIEMSYKDYNTKLTLKISDTSITFGLLSNQPAFSLMDYKKEDLYAQIGHNYAAIYVGDPKSDTSKFIVVDDIPTDVYYNSLSTKITVTYSSDESIYRDDTDLIPNIHFKVNGDATINFVGSFHSYGSLLSIEGPTFSFDTYTISVSLTGITPLQCTSSIVLLAISPSSICYINDITKVTAPLKVTCPSDGPVAKVVIGDTYITVICNRRERKVTNRITEIISEMSENPLILAVEQNAKKLFIDKITLKSNSVIFVDDSWSSFSGATFSLVIDADEQSSVTVQTANKNDFPASIKFTTKEGTEAQPTVKEAEAPEIAPIYKESNVCVETGDGQKLCAEELSEITVPQSSEYVVSFDIPQKMSLDSLFSDPETKLDRAELNALIPLIIDVECTKQFYNIGHFSVHPLALNIQSENDVTFSSERIDFSEVPYIVSSHKVHLDTRNLSITAGLLNSVSIHENLPSLSVSAFNVSLETDKRVFCSSQKGTVDLSYAPETENMRLTATGERLIYIKSSDVSASFSKNSPPFSLNIEGKTAKLTLSGEQPKSQIYVKSTVTSRRVKDVDYRSSESCELVVENEFTNITFDSDTSVASGITSTLNIMQTLPAHIVVTEKEGKISIITAEKNGYRFTTEKGSDLKIPYGRDLIVEITESTSVKLTSTPDANYDKPSIRVLFDEDKTTVEDSSDKGFLLNDQELEDLYDDDDGLSDGAIAGIVIAAVAVFAASVAGVLVYVRYRRNKNSQEANENIDIDTETHEAMGV